MVAGYPKKLGIGEIVMRDITRVAYKVENQISSGPTRPASSRKIGSLQEKGATDSSADCATGTGGDDDEEEDAEQEDTSANLQQVPEGKFYDHFWLPFTVLPKTEPKRVELNDVCFKQGSNPQCPTFDPTAILLGEPNQATIRFSDTDEKTFALCDNTRRSFCSSWISNHHHVIFSINLFRETQPGTAGPSPIKILSFNLARYKYPDETINPFLPMSLRGKKVSLLSRTSLLMQYMNKFDIIAVQEEGVQKDGQPTGPYKPGSNFDKQIFFKNRKKVEVNELPVGEPAVIRERHGQTYMVKSSDKSKPKSILGCLVGLESSSGEKQFLMVMNVNDYTEHYPRSSPKPNFHATVSPDRTLRNLYADLCKEAQKAGVEVAGQAVFCEWQGQNAMKNSIPFVIVGDWITNFPVPGIREKERRGYKRRHHSVAKVKQDFDTKRKLVEENIIKALSLKVEGKEYCDFAKLYMPEIDTTGPKQEPNNLCGRLTGGDKRWAWKATSSGAFFDFMFYCGPANSFEVTDSRIDANLAAFDRGNPVNTFDATDLPYCALDSISGHRPVYMDIEANPDRMDVATDV